MDRLRVERRPVRAAITRVCNEIQAELHSGVIFDVTLRVKYDRLGELLEQVTELDNRITTAMFDEDAPDEEVDAEVIGAEAYRDQITAARIQINDALKPASRPGSRQGSPTPSESSYSTANGGKRRTFQLPKIELKKFNGELKEWIGFWAQFEKIHSDTDLHTTDKFQYLIQSMVPGTRARHLVESYPQSADNYHKVIDALKNRFGDKTLLTELYVRDLIKLVVANVGADKAKKPLGSMFDELESHLRALETLGVTSDQSAVFLYPLVESSLPLELIKVWQRSEASGYGSAEEKPVNERLKSLMSFVEQEVKGAERLMFVQSGMSELKLKDKPKKIQSNVRKEEVPTTAGLHVGDNVKCVFCDKGHESRDCIKAQSMEMEQKRDCLGKKKCCFACLRQGHQARDCKAAIRCMGCGQKHPVVMCPQLNASRADPKKSADVKKAESTASNLACSSQVILKTLMVMVRGKFGQKCVRALLDDGSQQSYILANLAEELGLVVTGAKASVHALFGGIQTSVCQHKIYEVKISGADRGEWFTFDMMDQAKICGHIPRMKIGPWIQQLRRKNIWLSDLGKGGPEISMLIGADVLGRLTTGHLQLDNGLTAVGTKLGWTLMGKPNDCDTNDTSLAMVVTNLSVMDSSVEQLWRLDTIGISDPAEHKSKVEREALTKEHFLRTVTRYPDGRYCVTLPWMDGAQKIPDNKMVAERRLQNMTKKLVADGYYEAYDEMLKSWKEEGIIEEVPEEGWSNKHTYYLPHRAVIKPKSSTTPVRPVFDASCKTGRAPSLNDCLEKGPNLLDLIPSLIARFRIGKFGVVSDIRKAFLMVGMDECDRDYLRFLWWESSDRKKMKIYRHRRVVFGVNSSPFLLAAVIELHLRNVSENRKSVAEKLLKSMYVDNCVTSVDSLEEYEEFKSQATEIMADAKMDLRLWQRSSGEVPGIDLLACRKCGLGTGRELPDGDSNEESVLGYKWNKTEDVLSVSLECEEDMGSKITKRKILSCAQRIFDPIGFTSPVSVLPKLILQEVWEEKLGWDEDLAEDVKLRFNNWYRGMQTLEQIQIPRNMTGLQTSRSKWQFHVFCDASKLAYAAVVFLRTEGINGISVQLVQAKTRVSPIKTISIPRLELLACVIGVRLMDTLKTALDIKDVPIFYWSDSTTALAWIKRNDDWGTFVGNRVKEICRLSNHEDWTHVPGHLNPADLPSRGCSASELLASRWWEGPAWLKGTRSEWPAGDPNPDEETVLEELKKTVKTTALVSTTLEEPWYLSKFSCYNSNVRVMAWILRFIDKSRKHSGNNGLLTVAEFDTAERTILKMVQSGTFIMEAGVVNRIRVTNDSFGLLRVSTKLMYRHDTLGFRQPILLPHHHPIVDMLIRSQHIANGHSGIQFLMGKLRENYWILQGRKAIRRVVSKCVICRRFSSQKLQVEPAPLPEDRVKSAKVFEVVGVDLAGPLYLKKKEKSWIVLFTCAVYRCLHLELVRSLSTESFLESLSRFISRRGRPTIIWSDNGTNFLGSDNAFKALDWKKIMDRCNIQRIEWKFNPPSAAWWGGWWERLVRSIKELLRRILGRRIITFDQFSNYLCEIEAHINGRPLTTVTEDPEDLSPLTPAMFLHDIPCSSFAELDFMTGGGFQEAFKQRKNVLDEFKTRFRKEYLAQLVQKGREKPHQLKIGDVVLIGSDNKKRWEWPIAKIVELHPGKDGHIRVAKVKTAGGYLVRPVQRLYPLEVTSAENEKLNNIQREQSEEVPVNEEKEDNLKSEDLKEIRTMRGRLTKVPLKYGK